MRKVGSLFASALLVVAVGCGSDGGTKNTDAGKGVDGAVTPGVDSGTTSQDGPLTVIDAPAIPDAPIVIDGSAIDAPKGVDGPALIDTGKAIDSTVNPGIDAGKGIDAGTVNPGIDAGKGIDTGAAGTCNMPTCMAALAQDCAPSGACVTQTDTVTATMTSTSSDCYANGVKTVRQTDLTSGTSTVTLKNSAGVCYSMLIDVAAVTAGGAIAVKNAAGATIATLTYDLATQQTTVTCPGGQPVLLNSACTGLMSTIGSSSNCTAGTCAP
jgi:hypothetical protein